jgi:WD40 repeat protein
MDTRNPFHIGRTIEFPRCVCCVAWATDGHYIAAGTNGGRVHLINSISGKIERNLKGHDFNVSCVCFSPDSSMLASSCAADHCVRIWYNTTLQPKATVKESYLNVHIIAWSPDSSKIAVGGGGYKVQILDSTHIGTIAVLKGSSYSYFTALSWSPDGMCLATALESGLIQLWDTNTWNTGFAFDVYTNSIISIAWCPTGNRLFSCSKNEIVGVWDTQNGKQIAAHQMHNSRFVSPQAIWSPDATKFVTGQDVRSIRLWKVTKERVYCAWTFNEVGWNIRNVNLEVAWSHDSKRILTSVESVFVIFPVVSWNDRDHMLFGPKVKDLIFNLMCVKCHFDAIGDKEAFIPRLSMSLWLLIFQIILQ